MTDLADLGKALQIGLVSVETAHQILQRTDQTLAALAQGQFPFAEVKQAQKFCRQLGW